MKKTLEEKAEEFIDEHYDPELKAYEWEYLIVKFCESQNQWIPVSKELPIEGKYINIAFHAPGGSINVTTGFYFNSKFWHDLNHEINSAMSWQPLPIPPKKGE